MAANTTRSFYQPAELSAEVVVSVFELISTRLDPDVVEKWTEIELLVAYDYAIRNHLRASDNPTRLRDEPWLVKMAATATKSLSVDLQPTGCVVEHRQAGPAIILGPEHDIGASRVRMAFDEAGMREKRVWRIVMANYSTSCPSGERIVARADTREAEVLYLTEYGQRCDHGFHAPEFWIGNWEPS